MNLTTGQVAAELNARFGVTNINAQKIKDLVEAGAFTNVGAGQQLRIDSAELDDFLRRTRYVTRDQWPTDHLFRVSLVSADTELYPELDVNGHHMRPAVGAHYGPTAHPLMPTAHDRDLAWLGVWPVSEKNAQLAVDARAYLFGTTKGYIHPDYVRRITGYHRTTTGQLTWWEAEPLDADMAAFVGTGLWMNVKPGRTCDWA